MRLRVLAVTLFVAMHFRGVAVAASALPKVEVADVQAPVSSEVVVPCGSNLRAIAVTAYGSEEFANFLGQLNGVLVPERLQAGATLKTPSLPVAFRDARLDPRYQPAMNALAKTWQDLQTILPEYARARDASGLRDGKSFQIAPELQRKLVGCADVIDAATEIFRHPANGQSSPKTAVRQFAEASSSLRELSTGVIGSHDYDLVMIQKRMGAGFYHALMWTQKREP